MTKEEIKEMLFYAKMSIQDHLKDIRYKINNNHILTNADKNLMYIEIATLKKIEEIEKSENNV